VNEQVDADATRQIFSSEEFTDDRMDTTCHAGVSIDSVPAYWRALCGCMMPSFKKSPSPMSI
jgi:hypothetical protein